MKVVAVLLLSGLSLSAMAGCEMFGMAADVIAPSKNKAVYALADRPTLILVDDPGNHLGSEQLTDRVAVVMEHELKREKVVSKFVAMGELHALAERRGRDFGAMSLQDVGRALDAEQVIHIHVEQMDVETEPGAMRPQAWFRVKVLDVGTGQRMFPVDRHRAAGPSTGYRHHTQMRQSIRPVESAGDRVVLFDRFAEVIGQDLAKLFYDHLPAQVGDLGRDIRDAR